MALGASIRKAIGILFRPIWSAVTRGENPADVVASAIDQIGTPEAAQLGVDTALANQMTGYVTGLESATANFAAAYGTDAITANMIANMPWSMGVNEYNTLNSHHVLVGLTVEGVHGTQWRWITGVGPLPPTKDELMNFLDVQAAALSVGTTPGGGLGGTVTSIDSVGITIAPSGG